MAAYFSVLRPGDRILGMNLAHGGHLTHGSPVNFSGRLYEVHAYGVTRETETIDYDALERQAAEVRPKLLVAGASAYPRTWDFERMAAIAHGVGALLFVDMAHVAGLVAAGLHPSPFPHADLVTTTTHKTLRGPRGGLVFARADLPPGVDRADFPALGKGTLAQAMDKSVFPGVQGGPLMHVIAAKAVALELAITDDFRRDQARTIENAVVLAQTVADAGARLVSGGTDNHLALVDVTPLGVTGRDAEALLDDVGITVNKNAIPFDAEPAQRRERHPGRHAGHDDARLRAGRDAPGRPTDRGGDPAARRRRRPRPHPRRGPGARRALPGAGAAAGPRLTRAAHPDVR